MADVFPAGMDAVGPGIVREVPNARPADVPEVHGERGVLDDRDHVATRTVVVVRRDPDRDPVPDLAVI